MTLSKRIERGRAAIEKAKAQGRDVATWEAHLAGLGRSIAEAEQAGPAMAEQAAEIDAGEVRAVLIDSSLLGEPIWFAFKDRWRPEQADGVPVFYASELPALRENTAEQLRAIFNIKRTFGGGMVRQ